MKQIIYKSLVMVMAIAMLASCKKEETTTPTPTPNTPSANNKPALIAEKWVTKKVFVDGAEQANHFLVGSIYQFKDNSTYSFLMPNIGSANGTWSFTDAAQVKLKLEAQGTVTIWDITTISATALVTTYTGSDGKVTKYEFSHP